MEEKPYFTQNSLARSMRWPSTQPRHKNQECSCMARQPGNFPGCHYGSPGEGRLCFPPLAPAGTSRLSLAWPGEVSAGCTAEQVKECRTPRGCSLPLLAPSGSGLQTRITDFQGRGITCLFQYLWCYLFSLPLLSSHPLNGLTLPDSKYVAELGGPPGGFEMYGIPRLNSVHVEDVFFWRIWFSSSYRKCIFITFSL